MRRALLINWDNYPNVVSGGVYFWTKSLVEKMSDWEFVILNQLSNPNADASYALPRNVSKVIEFPIFGTNRYEEFHREEKAFFPKVLSTSESVVREKFIPLYKDFLFNILSDNSDPYEVAKSISKIHKFLMIYDAKKCFEHYLTWEIFLDRIRVDQLYKEMTLKDALTNYQMLQRSMQILSIEIPKVDVIHCSLAWLPSMIAICAKIEDNTPVISTEHGVAFRELILYYNAFLDNEPSKIFWTAFTNNVVRAVYSIADIIVPVCQANEAWEWRLGANKNKTRVIYNGIDTQKFRPMDLKRADNRPTVVSVARVSVFKDIVGLIQAISYVSQNVKDVKCLLFGESREREYSERCTEMVKKLRLENNFKFMGGTREPEKAYNLGDVVAFSSITEGFPFAIIEAMACGKAVVATNVGGIDEALEGCGLLVKSRSPKDLANGILTLLRDKELRKDLETKAISRAKNQFSIERSTNQYRQLYEQLASSREKTARREAPIFEVIRK
ncbi:MAG: GT4 family glycosyltransferase PelF [Nitrososphaerales archaeon]